MKEERRAVLSLIAAGRITAAEAERLIAAWTADRDALWLTVAALALAAVQGLIHTPAWSHLAHALEPALHTFALTGKGLGGLL